jgi:hypothetical protein
MDEPTIVLSVVCTRKECAGLEMQEVRIDRREANGMLEMNEVRVLAGCGHMVTLTDAQMKSMQKQFAKENI